MARDRHRGTVPVRVGKHYQPKQQARQRSSLGTILVGAALVGVLGGGASALVADPSTALSKAKPIAVGLGLARARAPEAGDYWPRCATARATGTAPIYAGEPGYREGLDGDSDGIACEPYRGQ